MDSSAYLRECKSKSKINKLKFSQRTIDLHDHPSMLVTSKIFLGEVIRTQMDLVDTIKQYTLPQVEVQNQASTLIK